MVKHNAEKIRVLVVDDSKVMQKLLTSILQEDGQLDVVGVASDPFVARSLIKSLRPDVLTLDVDMPGMDGITFLEKLMRLHPMPVVMVSSLTERGTNETLRALILGAVDFVAKPTAHHRGTLGSLASELCAKVRAAAMAQVECVPPAPRPGRATDAQPAPSGAANAQDIVVIGASAGGTQALASIFGTLPSGLPGIAVVQHMPPKFTALFADHLKRVSVLDVQEARDGERLEAGSARIAPGGRQMTVVKVGGAYRLRVYDAPPVNLHRPSVDVLFHSTAECAGEHGAGVLLTGMGHDGARGLMALHRRGALTLAQDEATSMIFGMPAQAIRLGAAQEVLPLDKIADRLQRWAARGLPTAASA